MPGKPTNAFRVRLVMTTSIRLRRDLYHVDPIQTAFYMIFGKKAMINLLTGEKMTYTIQVLTIFLKDGRAGHKAKMYGDRRRMQES